MDRQSYVGGLKGHKYLGLVSDNTPDMRSRLVLGGQSERIIPIDITQLFIVIRVAEGPLPASSFDNICGVEGCPESATYSSSVWHVVRDSREIIPAYSSGNQGEAKLGGRRHPLTFIVTQKPILVSSLRKAGLASSTWL